MVKLTQRISKGLENVVSSGKKVLGRGIVSAGLLTGIGASYHAMPLMAQVPTEQTSTQEMSTDFNKDGKVDFKDMQDFSNQWLVQGGDPNVIPVYECGCLDQAGKTYKLMNDVNSSDNCFSINADDINLNLNNYGIIGVGNPSSAITALSQKGVKIQDGRISGNFSVGIYFNVSSGLIKNITLTGLVKSREKILINGNSNVIQDISDHEGVRRFGEYDSIYSLGNLNNFSNLNICEIDDHGSRNTFNNVNLNEFDAGGSNNLYNNINASWFDAHGQGTLVNSEVTDLRLTGLDGPNLLVLDSGVGSEDVLEGILTRKWSYSPQILDKSGNPIKENSIVTVQNSKDQQLFYSPTNHEGRTSVELTAYTLNEGQRTDYAYTRKVTFPSGKTSTAPIALPNQVGPLEEVIREE